MAEQARWQFFIDRGGTFTDCIGRDPASGALSVVKVPSNDDAPLVGIRRLLGLPEGAPIPPCELRLGTTLGTNALLERRGARSALLLTRGFGDLLELGDQTRPDLFALEIQKRSPLPERVLEVDARLAADGSLVQRPGDQVELGRRLRELRESGVDSLGIAVLNDYREGALEAELAELARESGFQNVATGFEVAPTLGYLTRASSVAIDAYVTPLLQRYLAHLREQLPGSRLRLMQSSGGLCAPERFRGAASVLSGPAGGAEALAAVARAADVLDAVGFDMGGTSTDVTRVERRLLTRVHECEVAGVRISAPMLDVHTVAAGGGSICRFDGERLRVGPESVGAEPGPLCYGSPAARELSLSDVNLVLGRLIGDRFPLPLAIDAPLAALSQLAETLSRRGHAYTPLAVAEGFFRIANANMAQAIREVTVGRGLDLREHALVVFGGAGGQHACALARELMVREVLFHPLAGVLSAWGIGISGLSWDGSRDAGGKPVSEASLGELQETLERLVHEGCAALVRDGADSEALQISRALGVRYTGTETVLNVPFGDVAGIIEDFSSQFHARFGYLHADRALEIAQVYVQIREAGSPTSRSAAPTSPVVPPTPTRRARLYFDGEWLEDVPVYHRERLAPGTEVHGPAVIAEATGTIVLEPGFVLSSGGDGLLRVTFSAAVASIQLRQDVEATTADPVLLELYANRFMSIAEQMGRTLQKTAMSVNIRERLDFSCAVFDADGELIANAPHIPVHLGAMSESVKAVIRAHPRLQPGDLFATNDPAHGGSHLPDITVVAPVHDPNGTLRFFSAARGHHADVGGRTPGSMPAFSRTLAEEGIVLSSVKVGHAGCFERERLRSLFESGPWPARRVSENLADLEAQLAAVRTGATLLLGLAEERGFAQVESYMRFVQDNAASEVQRALGSLKPGRHAFSDALDDGTALRVALEVGPSGLDIDFAGTGPEHAGNLNAPRAVTLACVLYFLRVLVGKAIPLNSGCLRHVSVHVPERCLLSPGPERAVAGGNVETSQRVVDLLLAAAGVMAASQGTMNNLSFGDGSYGYYETIAGGAGAGPAFAGASAVHTHMTNTRITDAEVMERRFPVRVIEHAVRRGSGGNGRTAGGDGVHRVLEFQAPAHVSVLSERRVSEPFGLAGGLAGMRGKNLLNGTELANAASFDVVAGDRLSLLTPGGGGFGVPHPPART